MADTTQRIETELANEIKIEAIKRNGNPNISTNDAIKFIFEQYKGLIAVNFPEVEFDSPTPKRTKKQTA